MNNQKYIFYLYLIHVPTSHNSRVAMEMHHLTGRPPAGGPQRGPAHPTDPLTDPQRVAQV